MTRRGAVDPVEIIGKSQEFILVKIYWTVGVSRHLGKLSGLKVFDWQMLGSKNVLVGKYRTEARRCLGNSKPIKLMVARCADQQNCHRYLSSSSNLVSVTN